MTSIALLEDSHHQADMIRTALVAAAFECEVFARADDFLRAHASRSYDLVILDWLLPSSSGIEVLRQIRATSRMPVVFVTVLDDEQDIVGALNAGADDYLPKPIRPLELVARIRAVLRRSHANASAASTITVEPFQIDTVRRSIARSGQLIELTDKEFVLASFLLTHLGRLITREEICRQVPSWNSRTESRTLDTHLSRVRRKLRLQPEEGFIITMIYGVGYRVERVGE